MSTINGSDRKRKPSDPLLEHSPASKHIKTGEIMASTGVTSNMLPRQALQQLVTIQPGMNDEQKARYLTALDQLRNMIEKHGPTTPEGQQAQARYEQIINRLRASLRQQQPPQHPQSQQQQQQQQQQKPQQQQQQPYSAQGAGGAMAGVPGNNGAAMVGVGGTNAPGGMNAVGQVPPIAQKNTWIVPPGIPPQSADAWRVDIQAKLTQVGQKMANAKVQLGILQQALQRQTLSPEQRAELQQKVHEVSTNYNGLKDILNKFSHQQKILAAQTQMQPLAQQNQPNQMGVRAGQQQGQVPMAAGGQMQKPAPQGKAPEAQQGQQHSAQQQQGMMSVGGQQQTTTSDAQGGPPNLHQPAQSTNQMQQPQQHQQQIQHQNPPAQRISTPIQRADPPPGQNNNVAGVTQNRPAVGRQTMSPASQQPQMQQPSQPIMNQPQQQQQAPHQVSGTAQRALHQQAPQVGAAGRSPALGPAALPGTPMAQPNSPAPRPGSVQPSGRPPTAAGTPVAQQQPPPQQQSHRIQAATAASAASPTNTMHPTQTTRDTAQGHRLPIPKNLTVNNSQPIAVPPARPTLSGGMNNSGSQIMSTPAVTKPPAFEFDEGGMGLLNKRKLEELVKQIDPEEKLDPDVEEAILELVDEFIDNIATSACKMAKIRGSDTLDIKDIQIILERNWNIRIPGYAADEIRTVRKFNPAQGYHQKMAALAAQKQLAQTSGKGGD